jgi:hypothetical protein
MLFIFLGLRLTGTAGIGTAWRREDFNMRSEQNWRPLSRNQVSKALELLLRIGGVRGLGEIFRAPKTAAPLFAVHRRPIRDPYLREKWWLRFLRPVIPSTDFGKRQWRAALRRSFLLDCLAWCVQHVCYRKRRRRSCFGKPPHSSIGVKQERGGSQHSLEFSRTSR